MNKAIIILSFLLMANLCFSQSQPTDPILESYLKTNKEMIDKAAPLMEFFFKYEDSLNSPTQVDFDKLLTIYGEGGNAASTEGLTKEQAFQFVDFYIKASQAKAPIQKDTTIKEEKSEMNILIEKTSNELPGMIQSVISDISFDEFKALMQMTNPNASEIEMKKEYLKMQKANKK